MCSLETWLIYFWKAESRSYLPGENILKLGFHVKTGKGGGATKCKTQNKVQIFFMINALKILK